MCAPLTLVDAQALGSELRKNGQTQLGRVVNDPAYAKLPVAAQVAVAAEAGKLQAAGNATGLSLDAAESMAALMIPRVLALAVWLAARRQHPGLTLEEVRAGITEDDAAQVAVEWSEATMMDELPPKPGPS